MNQDDLQSLVERAQDGDEVAFSAVFDTFYNRVHAYAFRRVLDTDIAEDIAAQTFYKLVKQLHKFTWRHEHSLSGYIFRIANNEVNQHLRKNSRVKTLEIPDIEALSDPTDSAHDVVEKELDSHARYVELNKALKILKPRQQDIIHMYFFEDLSHREIGIALKMKEGAVRTDLHRALKRLGNALESIPGFATIATNEGGTAS